MRQHLIEALRLLGIMPIGYARVIGVLAIGLSGFGFPAAAYAVILDPPAPRCASVNVAGDVTVTWTLPSDPDGDCAQLEIWHAIDAAGPFNLLATPACGSTSYFHVGAGANAGPQFYFLTTVSSSPPPNTSIPSDTVATIFLQVFQSTPLGSANLTWNAAAMAPSAAASFSIWLEYPVGSWAQIATVPTTTFAYQWPVSICEDSLTFRVGLADGSGCTSFSNRDGEVFLDVTPPSIPVIIAVSVDSLSDHSTITWSQPPELDTQGYLIIYNAPGGAVIVDTIFGAGNTSYEWLDSWPFGGPEGFTIAAFDSCQTGTPPSPNISPTGPSHFSMFAQTDYERCAGSMRITWTPYVGWQPQSHQVLLRVDGGPWAVVANLSGSATQHMVEVEPGRTYCALVKAIHPNGLAASLSNKACRFTVYPAVPQANYLRTVTVTGPDRILVVDSVDYAAEAGGYRLERSTNGGAFTTVRSFPATAGPLIQWTDGDVQPATNAYQYRMQVLDSCRRPAFTSNIGANIVLQASANLDGVNTLRWNGYVEWAGIVAGYRILRSVADGPFEAIAIVPPTPWEYVDDVNAFVELTGRFCYRVEAIEAGNPSGIDATSVSNDACAFQSELVFIPNAFIIGSAYNPIFKPVIGFTEVFDYRLLITNRWGLVIWETEDPEEGWDGVVGSQVMPIGIYAYYCSVRNGAGKLVEKRGTVTLIAESD